MQSKHKNGGRSLSRDRPALHDVGVLIRADGLLRHDGRRVPREHDLQGVHVRVRRAKEIGLNNLREHAYVLRRLCVHHALQRRRLGHWGRLQHAAMGEAIYNAPPFRFSRTRVGLKSPAPLLGEHTREVLAEAGLTAAEIAAATGG